MSASLLSRKQKHLKRSTFQKVMGKPRDFKARSDSIGRTLKVSRTRKIGHGRYTLSRSKVKAAQKHLMKDIIKKHNQNIMRRRARDKSKGRRSSSRSKSQRRGIKRRRNEM